MAKSPAKKVLFTSHTANFQKFNRPFMRMLKKQGYTVHYASAGEEEVLDTDEHFTVPFERSPFKPGNIKAYFALKKVIDREGYDLIHTHTPMGSVVTRLAARAARKKGTRVIYTAHGFHFFKGAPLLNWVVYYPIEKFMARHTDTLVTINNEDYERAKAKFKTDVKYVPGVGVDPKKFGIKMTKADKTKLRKSLGLKDSDFVIIYAAELSKRKNQQWLLRALRDFMATHPDVHLVLPGIDSLKGTVQNLANELGLSKQIHFLGYRDDIPRLMKSADIAVSASLQEGLPVNVMEAMYLGLPIVATDCRGNRDLVGYDYIVANLDATAMSEKVSQLYADPTLRAVNAKKSREKIGQYLLDEVKPLMVSHYASPKKVILHLLASSQYSGAENVASEIILSTDSEEFDSYYVSPVGSITDTLSNKGVAHVPIKAMTIGEVRRVVKQYRPVIIHAHDFKASIVSSFFSRYAKVISHIHQNPAWLNRIDPRTVAYRVRSRLFHKVIVVTEAMRGNKVFRSVDTPNIITLRNHVDISKITALGNPTKKRQYDIVFCGRLEPVKQPLEFLKVVAEIREFHPNVRVVMVGTGALMGECEEFVSEHDLVSNVTFAGFQDNPYQYIAKSRYLFLTSQDEGFGLVLIEAAILGAVPFAYALEATRELLEDDDFIAVDSKMMVAMYKSSYRSSEYYATLQAKACERVNALLGRQENWERAIADLYKTKAVRYE